MNGFNDSTNDGTIIRISGVNYCRSKITEINIKEGTRKIEPGQYRNLSSLSSITIPFSVEEIGDRAFYGCGCGVESGIDSIIIPSSVRSIGYLAFAYSSIKVIIVKDSSKRILRILGRAFQECRALTSVIFEKCYSSSISTYKSKGNVNYSLGSHVFFNCSNLSKLIIPTSLKFDGVDQFQGCVILQDICLKSNMKIEDYYQEKYQTKIKRVELKLSVLTSINFFQKLSSDSSSLLDLSKITIGESGSNGKMLNGLLALKKLTFGYNEMWREILQFI